MRIVICGHATLLVETTDQVILIDPVFAEGLMSGALEFYPQRQFSQDLLPAPTLLVITHGHFDHFHAKSLDAISRDVTVAAPRDPALLEKLAALGFKTLSIFDPWDQKAFGHTRIVATSSQHDEPEFGLIIADDEAVFWHMADGEVTPQDGLRVRNTFGKVDAVSCKYQPVVNASMSYLRAAGSSFAARDVCEWLEAACVTHPRFIFPYASGLAFAGEHSWFNRYAFPLTQGEAARLLQMRLGTDGIAQAVDPGDVIEVHSDAIRHEPRAAKFVKTVPSAAPAHWEPVDISTLAGLSTVEERRELSSLLNACLARPFGLWLGNALRDPNSTWRNFIAWGVVWQLIVHAAPGERLCFAIDFRDPARIGFVEGEHADANLFTHIAGQSLYRVLRHEAECLIFWLAGAARSYEKIMSVRDGRFFFPEFSQEPHLRPTDPFTFFLRYHWSEG